MNQVKTIGVLLGLSAGISLVAFGLSSVPLHAAKTKATPRKASAELKWARDRIQLFKLLDSFEQRHGTAFEMEETKAAWRQRLEREAQLLPRSEAYVDGDVCMVGGYKGTFLSGRCKLKGSVKGTVHNQALLLTLGCGSTEQFACNPDLFGLTENKHLGMEGTTARTAPICISKREPRMTLTCMRESLKAAGAEIPADAQKDITKFSPDQVSEDSLKKWFWWMNSTEGKTSSLDAFEAVRDLCRGVLLGEFKAGIGVNVPRAIQPGETADAGPRPDLKAAFEALKKDPIRKADYQDCSKVQTLIGGAQPKIVTEAPRGVSTQVEPKADTPASGETPQPAQTEASGSEKSEAGH